MMQTKARWIGPYSKQVQSVTAGLCTVHPTTETKSVKALGAGLHQLCQAEAWNGAAAIVTELEQVTVETDNPALRKIVDATLLDLAASVARVNGMLTRNVSS